MALNFPDDALVTFEVQSNKRKGIAAYNRFEKYKHAKHLKDFFALGGSMRDFRYDFSQGLCKGDGQDYQTWLANGSLDKAEDVDVPAQPAVAHDQEEAEEVGVLLQPAVPHEQDKAEDS